MEEIWRQLHFYANGRYEVSNMGRVRTIYTTIPPKVLRTRVCKSNGYDTINFTFEGKKKTFTIHSLVAKLFIRDYDGNNEVVNHIDGNKLNNDVSNLEWVTHKENSQHASQMGLNDYQRTRKTKNNVSARKVTMTQANEIRSKYVSGSRTHGARALGREYGLPHTAILAILKGKTYTH